MSKIGFDGKRLKAIRERKAWGVEEFAHELNLRMGYKDEKITKRYIARWENEGSAPKKAEIIQCFAEILDCDTEDFFEPINNSKIPVYFNQYRVDFSDFIDDRTEDFVGRDNVFDQIKKHLKTSLDYIFIKGDPGFGKSAIASKIVKDKGYIHHFNIRSEGKNTVEMFMKNVCCQLIQNYNLTGYDLSNESFQNNNLLLMLLKQVSERLSAKQRLIVVVDALDEVRIDGDQLSSNVLYLPMLLPEKVTFIITMRNDKTIAPRLSKEHKNILLENDTSNMDDIEMYIMSHWNIKGIRDYLKNMDFSMKDFVEEMVIKSEGNFMYLKHVLPEIAKGNYKNVSIKDIPVNLMNYYDDHFKRINLLNEKQFYRKIKLLYILSEAMRPISCELLAEISSEKASFVQRVLIEWAQFLHKKKTGNHFYYSLYHSNFQEYLRSNDLIKAAGVDLKSIKKDILGIFDNFFKDE